MFVSSVARRAISFGTVHRISQLSLLHSPPVHAWWKGLSVNFTTAEELLQCDPVMAGMFTINSYPAYVLFDSGA
jgi:hypothetical protein